MKCTKCCGTGKIRRRYYWNKGDQWLKALHPEMTSYLVSCDKCQGTGVYA